MTAVPLDASRWVLVYYLESWEHRGLKRNRSRVDDPFASRLRFACSMPTIVKEKIVSHPHVPAARKVECHNRQALLDAVLDRGDRGLLTVSNHMCVYDDPGLWSALLPFWR